MSHQRPSVIAAGAALVVDSSDPGAHPGCVCQVVGLAVVAPLAVLGGESEFVAAVTVA